ncbi:Metalloprotease [Lactarius psammicola]|nr:Metalloprotease [Lactarius psammicola]
MYAVARSTVTKWRQPRRSCSLLAVGLALGLATRMEPRVTLGSIAGYRHFITPTSRFVHPSLKAVTRLFSISSASSGIFDTSSFSSSNMVDLTPPQPPPIWTHTPEDVIKLTKEAIEKDREVQDRVAKLPASECNFDTVFVRDLRLRINLSLARSDSEFSDATEPLSFYQHVSTSKELRDASNEAEVLVRDFGVESSMRIDVYNAKVAAQKNIESSGKKLNQEEQRLVEKMVQDGTRAGLSLPEADRERLTEWKKELSQVCLEFSKNFNEENGFISFTLEELKGVPEDVISGYPKREEGSKELYDVMHRTPDIFPLFKYAKSAETRRRAWESFDSRLDLNAPLFDRALELRRKIAALLGYNTWADYITEIKMVKSGDNFLSDLEQKLRPLGAQERETLLKLKADELKAIGEPFDGEIYQWDYRYYDRLYIEKTLSLDDALVKEYFPVSVVVPAILEIYQDLLRVRFHEVKDAQTWHPDAQMFAVWAEDAKDESAANSPMAKRSYPLTAMVANLAKPTPERPALMRHDDVVTFFHEMGHVFHGLLSRTQFARFHGTSVARDFVEAPSQMLENWCWEPKVLKKMSRHYKTNEPLSPELIKKIVQRYASELVYISARINTLPSRYVNVGLFYLRQVFFARFDLHVHTHKDQQDVTEVWNDMRDHISLFKGGKRSAGQGSFAHLVGGDEQILYSLVFAADMYQTVFKEDPLDATRGDRYRESILRLGGSREELDSLEEFLGRPPNSDAFMKELFGE